MSLVLQTSALPLELFDRGAAGANRTRVIFRTGEVPSLSATTAKFGVDDRARTGWVQFGRLALYLQRIAHMVLPPGLQPGSSGSKPDRFYITSREQKELEHHTELESVSRRWQRHALPHVLMVHWLPRLDSNQQTQDSKSCGIPLPLTRQFW